MSTDIFNSGDEISTKLEVLQSFSNSLENPELTIIKPKRKQAETRVVNWGDIRMAYVLGKRIEERDTQSGVVRIWSEDYSLSELAQNFGLGRSSVAERCSREYWVDLRKSYLARVSQEALGQELDYYGTVESESEGALMGMVKDLTMLVGVAINQEYGHVLSKEIIDAEPSIFVSDDNDIDVVPTRNKVQMHVIGAALGNLKQIMQLQKELQDNAPKNDAAALAEITKRKNTDTLRDSKERKRLKLVLEQRLRLLSQIDADDAEKDVDV